MNPRQRNRIITDIILANQNFREAKNMLIVLVGYKIEFEFYDFEDPTYDDVQKILNLTSDEILLQIAQDSRLDISVYSLNKNIERQLQIEQIFISHCHDDKEIAESFAQILEIMGAESTNIRATSLEGYESFNQKDSLQENLEFLDEKVMVFFMLSDRFFESPNSMVEMGLAFEKTRKQTFVAIESFDLRLIQKFFMPAIGINLGVEMDYKTLGNILQDNLGIKSDETFPWKPIFNIYLKLIKIQSSRSSKNLIE